MKFLLVAVNAKYIHSNLGLYSLKAYARERVKDVSVGLAEFTINHHPDEVLKAIYEERPDAVGFSCYIWNIEYIRRLVRDLPKILPQADIWLGGPEVSYDAPKVLAKEGAVEGIMVGEGEVVFARLLARYREAEAEAASGKANVPGGRETPGRWAGIPGLAYRGADGTIVAARPGPPLEMDSIPFPYEGLQGLEHRLIYYEGSRGCPFSCSYCLSSLDRAVRFRSLDLVKEELGIFLDAGVPQVKFIDRTFNCDRGRALEIWRYLHEHDRGLTNFHFEISADLLGEEELDLMERMRPGLIQLEIGVQSVNPQAIREIGRTMDLGRLSDAVRRIHGFGNIHQHLDLIAGLPWEGLESFWHSFDVVYRLRPDQLQLGFLKVLKGTCMEAKAQEYGLLYHSDPPYEVLSTRWISYGELLELKAVEEMVEVYHNSGQFRTALKALEPAFPAPHGLYEALAAYDRDHGKNQARHSRMERYEALYRFAGCVLPEDCLERFRDSLMHDLYLRENLKSRPSFARDQGPYKEAVRMFFREEARSHRYLKGCLGRDAAQLGRMAHIEVMGDGRWVLYDYQDRSPLDHNARTWTIRAGMDHPSGHGP